MHGISDYLYKNKNCTCLKKSTIRSMFQAPLDVHDPPNHRFLTACVECWFIELSRSLSEEISFDCGAKGQLLTLKDVNVLYPTCFCKQAHCTRAGMDTKGRQTNTLHRRIDTKVRQTDLDQQARHLPVIFANLEATSKTEKTFSNLSCSSLNYCYCQ